MLCYGCEIYGQLNPTCPRLRDAHTTTCDYKTHAVGLRFAHRYMINSSHNPTHKRARMHTFAIQLPSVGCWMVCICGFVVWAFCHFTIRLVQVRGCGIFIKCGIATIRLKWSALSQRQWVLIKKHQQNMRRLTFNVSLAR